MKTPHAGETSTGPGQPELRSLQSSAGAGTQFVLASGSPRRHELLRAAGYDFVVDPADIDETQHPRGLGPAELVQYLAERKAASVALRYPDKVVLAADTVVALGKEILGKPEDAAHATAMLSGLSGTHHSVWTGVSIRAGPRVLSACVRSDVYMRELTAEEIAAYVAGGQWQGKAGGYGIQDPDPFVARIAGSETNIVGLPLDETRSLLARVGVVPRQPLS